MEMKKKKKEKKRFSPGLWWCLDSRHWYCEINWLILSDKRWCWDSFDWRHFFLVWIFEEKKNPTTKWLLDWDISFWQKKIWLLKRNRHFVVGKPFVFCSLPASCFLNPVPTSLRCGSIELSYLIYFEQQAIRNQNFLFDLIF